jgi:hypothetical protein
VPANCLFQLPVAGIVALAFLRGSRPCRQGTKGCRWKPSTSHLRRPRCLTSMAMLPTPQILQTTSVRMRTSIIRCAAGSLTVQPFKYAEPALPGAVTPGPQSRTSSAKAIVHVDVRAICVSDSSGGVWPCGVLLPPAAQMLVKARVYRVNALDRHAEGHA